MTMPLPTEEIVRRLASQRRMSSVLKRFGRVKPKFIANARKSFAQEMLDSETPLLLYDRSFLQNGKSGLLLTDEAVYSSTSESRVPLSQVWSAQVELPPDEIHSEETHAQLRVNGEVIFSQFGGSNAKLLQLIADALAEIASVTAMSNVDAGPGSVSPTGITSETMAMDSESLARLAAGGVCAGQAEDEIVSYLCKAGASRPQAEGLVRKMRAIRNRPRRENRLARALGGIGLLILGIVAMAAAKVIDDFEDLWIVGVIAAGVGTVLISRGFSKHRELTVDELLASFEIEEAMKEEQLT
jgi:hypothetical protein